MSKELIAVLMQHTRVDNYECRCGWTAPAGTSEEAREMCAAHVVSQLKDAGYSIVKGDNVELLRRLRWTVDGNSPMDLKGEYADGFNAAMRLIHRVLHPSTAAAEGDTND